MIRKVNLVFILLCFNINAQTPSFFVIGEEKFSNTDIYTLYYDDDTDILFVGTNRGVYSYTQNKFNQIASHKDQLGNSFFQLKKDKKGSLFCANLVGQIFEIKEDSLVLYYQIPKNDIVIDFRYFFDNENNLIVSTTQKIRKVTELSDSILLNLDPSNKQFYNSIEFDDGSIYLGFGKSDNYYKYYDGNLSEINFINSSFEPLCSIFQLGDSKYYNTQNAIVGLDDGVSYFSNLVEVQSVVYQLSANEIAVRNSKSDFYYIKYKNGKLTKTPSGFINKFISTVTQNENNTIFLGTFKEGIFVVPNKYISKQKSNRYFSGIASSINNEVYLSDNKGNIFKHNNGLKKQIQYDYNVDNLFFINGRFRVGNSIIDSFIHSKSNAEMLNIDFSNIKDLFEAENEFIIFISASNILIILADKSVKLKKEFAQSYNNGESYKIELDNRGQSVAFVKNDNNLYYSTNINLYVKKWNTDQTEIIKFNDQSIKGNDLISNNKQLIIGSENYGILFYENNIFKKQINLDDGLKSNTILELKIAEDLLFILSTGGLQIYDLVNKYFIGLGEREGVLSEKVTNFDLSHDKLWLLDKDGYYAYDIDQIKKNKKFSLGKVFLDSVVVNRKKIKHDSQAKFDFDENKFQFFFDYRDVETKSETKFYYQLLGVSNDWEVLNTSTNRVEFSALSPGKYTFVLKANYRSKETVPIKYSFRILQPYWFQTWFVLLSILFIVFFVSLFFISKIRRDGLARKAELKTQKMQTAIFESKLKAIRSQMNPHFIFNSLNSIQASVLKNDAEKSYDYIEMFSDLVRKTLSFSEKNYIPIKDEINFLTIYLDLEKLRMKDEFNFQIINNAKEEILIPSLLIQPFIENAILHGLLHKSGEKDLIVTFNIDKELANCIIIDNGIGRAKANEINKRQKYRHESFSLKAMKERLYILSEQNNNKFDYIIEDLYSDSGIAMGTKIIINFPFKHQY